ncbi:MAG: hypothetical protein JXM73_17140 [Anaerolineae bacterium]|nr:hypothetical protein [Anaerolineae bacterium]
MSCNTAIHIEPTIYRVKGTQVVPIAQVLGQGGACLLKKTLSELDTIRPGLGGEAAALLDWRRVGEDRYQTTVNGEPIILQLSGSIGMLEYALQGTDLSAGSTNPRVQALYAGATRKVNNLLAVAMANRISERLQQFVGQRSMVQQSVEQQVYQREANSYTLRINAYYAP